jgi:hypothetical protein
VAGGTIDRATVAEITGEIIDLRKRRDALEMVLLVLVRTGWPWQEDGEPNEMFRNARDGFATAMQEARELLGLEHRSIITRTEPRT